jgi:cyclase
MATIAYTKGLHELGDGLHAYLQPDGGYGWSNAGLVTAPGAALLVDTLFDLRCAQAMIDAMVPVLADSPIESVVNTHGDGDHCWGNQLMPVDARIYATTAALADMKVATPQAAARRLDLDLEPDTREFVETIVGPFELADIEVRLPDETIDLPRRFLVAGRAVDFIPVGPAHTAGDAIVHVPDADIVFTGDVLFAEGTPVTWHGPLTNWINVCDRLLALGARCLVPGHGPVTDASGVRDMKRYLEYVLAEARIRHDAGMSVVEAVADIQLGEFASWPNAERIVANVDAVYRELEPDREEPPRMELFSLMGSYRKRAGLRR